MHYKYTQVPHEVKGQHTLQDLNRQPAMMLKTSVHKY